jgi:hypothetical protein
MSRCSQRSGLSTVAQRSFMQVAGSIPEAGSLLRSVLLQQVQDLKLKLGNGALSTVGPILKGLRLLRTSNASQIVTICAPKHARSRCLHSPRELRLNSDDSTNATASRAAMRVWLWRASLAGMVCLSPLGRAAQLIQQLLALDRGSQQVERSTAALESPVSKGVLGRYLEGWYAMPVDLPRSQVVSGPLQQTVFSTKS